MIKAEGLTRHYGAVVAASEVSFEVGSGEIVGLLGHNGAGKTTVMKMLTGYLEPSSGRGLVDGIDVQDEPVVVQNKIGYLPENRPLYPDMSVFDYLAFTANMRGMSGSEAASALRDVIESMELGSRALDKIGTLSRGYQQRVGVAQAILHKPPVLILDEPTNGLDPRQTQEMRRLLRSLAMTATVVLSTHIMQEVDAICDRVLIMRDGELVIDEKLAELKRADTIELRTTASPKEVESALGASVNVVAENDRLLLTSETIDLEAFAAQVARALVTQDIPIHGLAPVQRDLERLFREVSEAPNVR
ncbi:MAG TPA: multidrug ABC transporter ATP-binding protein [Gammaproteobacteria bacterium]|nr:multidrug ABC transporter ATP-binding protein [Gammaproteobacteria bacterium]